MDDVLTQVLAVHRDRAHDLAVAQRRPDAVDRLVQPIAELRQTSRDPRL
jgi:hypothetical protein